MNEIDTEGMKERMDAIRLKQIMKIPLTEKELMCLQIEQNGFACAGNFIRRLSILPTRDEE